MADSSKKDSSRPNKNTSGDLPSNTSKDPSIFDLNQDELDLVIVNEAPAKMPYNDSSINLKMYPLPFNNVFPCPLSNSYFDRASVTMFATTYKNLYDAYITVNTYEDAVKFQREAHEYISSLANRPYSVYRSTSDYPMIATEDGIDDCLYPAEHAEATLPPASAIIPATYRDYLRSFYTAHPVISLNIPTTVNYGTGAYSELPLRSYLAMILATSGVASIQLRRAFDSFRLGTVTDLNARHMAGHYMKWCRQRWTSGLSRTLAYGMVPYMYMRSQIKQRIMREEDMIVFHQAFTTPLIIRNKQDNREIPTEISLTMRAPDHEYGFFDIPFWSNAAGMGLITALYPLTVRRNETQLYNAIIKRPTVNPATFETPVSSGRAAVPAVVAETPNSVKLQFSPDYFNSSSSRVTATPRTAHVNVTAQHNPYAHGYGPGISFGSENAAENLRKLPATLPVTSAAAPASTPAPSSTLSAAPTSTSTMSAAAAAEAVEAEMFAAARGKTQIPAVSSAPTPTFTPGLRPLPVEPAVAASRAAVSSTVSAAIGKPITTLYDSLIPEFYNNAIKNPATAVDGVVKAPTSQGLLSNVRNAYRGIAPYYLTCSQLHFALYTKDIAADSMRSITEGYESILNRQSTNHSLAAWLLSLPVTMAAVAASYPLVTHQARKIYQECTGIKPKLFSGVGGYMARFMLLYGAVSTVLNFADSEGEKIELAHIRAGYPASLQDVLPTSSVKPVDIVYAMMRDKEAANNAALPNVKREEEAKKLKNARLQDVYFRRAPADAIMKHRVTVVNEKNNAKVGPVTYIYHMGGPHMRNSVERLVDDATERIKKWINW